MFFFTLTVAFRYLVSVLIFFYDYPSRNPRKRYFIFAIVYFIDCLNDNWLWCFFLIVYLCMLMRVVKEPDIIKYFLSSLNWVIWMALSIFNVKILQTLFVWYLIFLSFDIKAIVQNFCLIFETSVYIYSP